MIEAVIFLPCECVVGHGSDKDDPYFTSLRRTLYGRSFVHTVGHWYI